VIGPDRNGVEWGTVGLWAQLRTNGGNPDPIGIELWEVGNEVYGGTPATGGSECASFGWEDVWTCDGAEYVSGTETNDGFLDIRRAMLAIDPSITVGAVGVADPDSWNGWGGEVIAGAGEELGFYVVHDYGFDRSPDPDEALARPSEMWPSTMESVLQILPDDVPVAVTEYNLVAFDAGDTDAVMSSAANAFFIADTIGQLGRAGASIANQWNLANGTAPSGTDYGLIEIETLSRRPQFAGFSAWSNAGTSLFPVGVGDDRLRVYPTRHDDGRWSVIAINAADTDLSTSFSMGELTTGASVETRSAVATDLRSSSMTNVVDSLVVGADGLTLDLPATSITTIDITPATDA
jgi:hypothetical protein